jgi:hypothetical protein
MPTHQKVRRLPQFVRVTFLVAAFGLSLLPHVFAQADNSASQAEPANQSAAQKEKKSLSVNPLTGLAATSRLHYRPLTGQERWKLYWQQNYFSMGAYFAPFTSALVLDQARGNPYEWGGGFPGYGRRAASRLGGAILQGTFQASVAALLKEEVRYIASDQRSLKRRAVHAVLYSFLTYDRRGHPTLNLANLGGYYASSAVSTLWLPGRTRVVRHTLSDGSLQVAISVPINLVQEFWPEIRHRAFHRR